MSNRDRYVAFYVTPRVRESLRAEAKSKGISVSRCMYAILLARYDLPDEEHLSEPDPRQQDLPWDGL